MATIKIFIIRTGKANKVLRHPLKTPVAINLYV
jgi:hypothetical protein